MESLSPVLKGLDELRANVVTEDPPAVVVSALDESVVVVPTYNEAANVRVVLQRLLAISAGLSVIVVDDNSPDGTGSIVSEIAATHPDGRVTLVTREGKQGLGTAYIAGFRKALAAGHKYVFEIDADLSHNPADIPRLIEPVQSGAADIAIGSRYVDGVRVMNWPLTRLILSYGAGIYTRAITRLPVMDVTAGFKCFHRRVLETIDLNRVRSNGYSFQIEMNYRAWRAGFRIAEVPIIFTERTEGMSKMSRRIVMEAAGKVWELRVRDLFRKL